MENTVENMNENESIKVLVVDDEQDIRTLLNIYLKRLGYEVVRRQTELRRWRQSEPTVI